MPSKKYWLSKPKKQRLTRNDLEALIYMFNDADCLAAQGVNRLSKPDEAIILARLEAMFNSSK